MPCPVAALTQRGGQGGALLDGASCTGGIGQPVALREDGDDGDFAGPELPEPVELGGAVAFAEKQHGDLRAVRGPERPLDALGAQCARVVESRGVGQEAGAEAGQLHRLRDGVGGGARNVGDHGDRLSRQRIDERGLAAVAAAEESDVQSFGCGCIVHVVVYLRVEGGDSCLAPVGNGSLFIVPCSAAADLRPGIRAFPFGRSAGKPGRCGLSERLLFGCRFPSAAIVV